MVALNRKAESLKAKFPAQFPVYTNYLANISLVETDLVYNKIF